MALAAPDPISETLNIVLLGAFNPAIFHPEWFVRHKLIGESELSRAEVNVISKDISEFTIGSVGVFCTDNRLIISIKRMADAPILQDIVLGILNLLPHTPVTAVGFNNEATYRVSSLEHWHRIGHTLVPKDPIWNKLCKNPGMQLVSILSALDWTLPLAENLSVQPLAQNNANHPGILLKANLHFNLPAADAESPSSADWTIRFISEQWDFASRRARSMADTLFQEIP